MRMPLNIPTGSHQSLTPKKTSPKRRRIGAGATSSGALPGEYELSTQPRPFKGPAQLQRPKPAAAPKPKPGGMPAGGYGGSLSSVTARTSAYARSQGAKTDPYSPRALRAAAGSIGNMMGGGVRPGGGGGGTTMREAIQKQQAKAQGRRFAQAFSPLAGPGRSKPIVGPGSGSAEALNKRVAQRVRQRFQANKPAVKATTKPTLGTPGTIPGSPTVKPRTMDQAMGGAFKRGMDRRRR